MEKYTWWSPRGGTSSEELPGPRGQGFDSCHSWKSRSQSPWLGILRVDSKPLGWGQWYLGDPPVPEQRLLTCVWAVLRLGHWRPLISGATNTEKPVGHLMKEGAGSRCQPLAGTNKEPEAHICPRVPSVGSQLRGAMGLVCHYVQTRCRLQKNSLFHLATALCVLMPVVLYLTFLWIGFITVDRCALLRRTP